MSPRPSQPVWVSAEEIQPQANDMGAIEAISRRAAAPRAAAYGLNARRAESCGEALILRCVSIVRGVPPGLESCLWFRRSSLTSHIARHLEAGLKCFFTMLHAESRSRRDDGLLWAPKSETNSRFRCCRILIQQRANDLGGIVVSVR